jgi:hypothetical protein
MDDIDSNDTEFYKNQRQLPSEMNKYGNSNPQFLIDRGVMQ